MFIVRNNKRIYLTPVEKQKIYREQLMESKKENAKQQLMEYYGITETSPEESEPMKLFRRDFGISFAEAADTEDPGSLISTMAWEYINKYHDLNIAENEMWRDIIAIRISERKNVG